VLEPQVSSQLIRYCNLGQQVLRDIEYGQAGGESLRLDAYLPEGAGPFPVAIVVHGGGWVAGDRRSNVEPLLQPLVDGGFACMSISYRLARDPSLVGAAIGDVEQAIRYAQAHSPGAIALVGESAGGQLAAMAALGKSGSAIRAVVGLYAPTDLEQLAPATPWAGVLLARMRELSPIHHLHSGMPPFLLIHGTADTVVPFEQSRNMCQAIRKAGGHCDLLAVKGGAHGVRRWESAGLTSYKRLMIDWLQKRLA
jgi:acetyl esterase